MRCGISGKMSGGISTKFSISLASLVQVTLLMSLSMWRQLILIPGSTQAFMQIFINWRRVARSELELIISIQPNLMHKKIVHGEEKRLYVFNRKFLGDFKIGKYNHRLLPNSYNNLSWFGSMFQQEPFRIFLVPRLKSEIVFRGVEFVGSAGSNFFPFILPTRGGIYNFETVNIDELWWLESLLRIGVRIKGSSDDVWW